MNNNNEIHRYIYHPNWYDGSENTLKIKSRNSLTQGFGVLSTYGNLSTVSFLLSKLLKTTHFHNTNELQPLMWRINEIKLIEICSIYCFIFERTCKLFMIINF